MSEPLTEEQLRTYEAYARERNDTNLDVTLAVHALLAEVARLRARNAVLEADFAMRNITAMLVLDHEIREGEDY